MRTSPYGHVQDLTSSSWGNILWCAVKCLWRIRACRGWRKLAAEQWSQPPTRLYWAGPVQLTLFCNLLLCCERTCLKLSRSNEMLHYNILIPDTFTRCQRTITSSRARRSIKYPPPPSRLRQQMILCVLNSPFFMCSDYKTEPRLENAIHLKVHRLAQVFDNFHYTKHSRRKCLLFTLIKINILLCDKNEFSKLKINPYYIYVC
jgi:hypothetical protein